MSTQVRREWLVLLEATDDQGGPAMDRASFGRLVACWAPPLPSTLFSEHRYAVHVLVGAASPPSALSRALDLWDDAVRRSGVPRWDLVRAEIVTPDEREREYAAADEQVALAVPEPLAVPFDRVGDDLLRQAFYDSVTDLPGRAYFVDEVCRQLVAGASRPVFRSIVVVAMDRLGSDRGLDVRPPPDALVVALAARLAGTVRRTDCLARVGAADFAVSVALDSECQTGEIVRRLVASAGRPLAYRGTTLTPRANIGVVSLSDGDNAEDLVLRAEMAAQLARMAGGDCSRRSPASSSQHHRVPIRRAGGRRGTKGRT